MNLKRRSSAVSILVQSIPALVVAVLLVLADGPAAYAQVDRAVLEGTVSDSTGGVLVGASVKVVAVETGLNEQQQTNSRGYYRISGLAVGGYTVTVSNSGFKTKVVQDV